ncbi:MAG: hypothetical protein ACJA15_001750, partial [Flavobacteriales bacterium]
MYKHAYILSNNAPLFVFLSKKVSEATDLTVNLLPEKVISHDGRVLIMVDSQKIEQSPKRLLIGDLRRRIPSADVVVFGEEDDHMNQDYVILGAIDFLNPRMLTSHAFARYLNLRITRDWLG